MTDGAHPEPEPLRLTKHHGLGNDFLVALLAGPTSHHSKSSRSEPMAPVGEERRPNERLTVDGLVAKGPELARQLCDRRRGIGADGLILAPLRPEPGTDAAMVLFNADGSRAEMSGNGIRCLGQALAMHLGLHDTASEFVLGTDAGPRRVQLQPGREAHTVTIRVGMGEVGPGPQWQPGPVAARALAELQGTDLARAGTITPSDPNPSAAVSPRAMTVSIGNPHLVILVDDPWAVDLAHVGPLLEADFPAGINVEFIAPHRAPATAIGRDPESGPAEGLDLAVWERGVGITEACGTGATAAATVAHRWGLVGSSVVVYMPGGMVQVTVDTEQSQLCGPSTFVAQIEVDLA